MSMQLSDFKTYVLQDFKRTDKDTELVRARNDAILYIAVLMPHGGYKYQSYVPTVAGTNNYPLPSDIMHLIHPVRLLEGSGTNDSGYPLVQITKQEYDLREPNPNRTSPPTAKPSHYCIFSRTILPTPIPDKSTYLFEIDWSKAPADQTGDSAAHSLGSAWDEVLKWMVLDRLNSGIELFQEAEFWRSKYEDAEHKPIGQLLRLLDIEREREHKAVGTIRPNNL